MKESEYIFHCCIQKTASQWIKAILSDPLILKKTGMSFFYPVSNYIGTSFKASDLDFPSGHIVSPLYIGYDDFIKRYPSENLCAFFVMRDLRDFIISYYFSMVFSHADNPYVNKIREDLYQLDQDQSISYFIRKFEKEFKAILDATISWVNGQKADPRCKVYRYEDLVGPDNIDWFSDLFGFLGIKLNRNKIDGLLKNYSFKKLSSGRAQGEEDRNSHYRKGIAGDWKNYFKDEHKALFKSITGDLLEKLGYEADNAW